MKPRSLLLALAIFLSLLPSPLRSQAPQPARALEVLKVMEAANQKLLERQARSLEALEEMKKTADQIKIFAKRT